MKSACGYADQASLISPLPLAVLAQPVALLLPQFTRARLAAPPLDSVPEPVFNLLHPPRN
jgi:hypothetical protein